MIVIFIIVLYLTSSLKPNYTLFLKTKEKKTPHIILLNNKSGCWKAITGKHKTLKTNERNLKHSKYCYKDHEGVFGCCQCCPYVIFYW